MLLAQWRIQFFRFFLPIPLKLAIAWFRLKLGYDRKASFYAIKGVCPGHRGEDERAGYMWNELERVAIGAREVWGIKLVRTTPHMNSCPKQFRRIQYLESAEPKALKELNVSWGVNVTSLSCIWGRKIRQKSVMKIQLRQKFVGRTKIQ